MCAVWPTVDQHCFHALPRDINKAGDADDRHFRPSLLTPSSLGAESLSACRPVSMASEASAPIDLAGQVLAYWPFIVVVSFALVLSKTYFSRGMHRLPSPLLANFTDAWRVWDVGRSPRSLRISRQRGRPGLAVRPPSDTLNAVDLEYVSMPRGGRWGSGGVFPLCLS